MATTPTPCVGICRLDRAGICVGCGRLLDEIAAWPVASEARRRTIAAAARERLSHLKSRRTSDR